jgi:hypothetical protein
MNVDVSSFSFDRVLELYRDSAELHGISTQEGKYRAANKAAKRVAELHAEVKRRGPEAEEALLRMLTDHSAYVRLWVATHCLAFRADLAVAALEELISLGGHVGLGAEMTLKEWRAGRLQL